VRWERRSRRTPPTRSRSSRGDSVDIPGTISEDRTGTDSEDTLGHGDLDLLYDASLVVLVRLIVAFAVERRRRRLTELPDEPGSDEHGDDERGGAESGTAPVQSANLRSIARAVAAESDGSGPSYTDRTAELWSRLEEFGSPIGHENRSGEDDSRTARFLENHRIGDASLATAIDLLARRRADGGEKPFIDYSSLDGRRLGDISTRGCSSTGSRSPTNRWRSRTANTFLQATATPSRSRPARCL